MLHTNNNVKNLPHGLGLLTTVASLPPKYRSRYLHIKTAKYETPLDLTVKTVSPNNSHDHNDVSDDVQQNSQVQQSEHRTTLATFNPNVYKEVVQQQPQPQQQQHVQQQRQQQFTTTITSLENGNSMTPPLTPTPPPPPPPTPTTTVTIAPTRVMNVEKLSNHLKKRKFAKIADEQSSVTNLKVKLLKKTIQDTIQQGKQLDDIKKETEDISTPLKPIKANETAPRTHKHTSTTTTTTTTTVINAAVGTTQKSSSGKNKATRKLKFDEENSSPVSGTIIRPLEDITDGTVQYSNGDIDPRYNIVEISEESKAELAAIKNVIGDYICKLCRLKFDDAFGLARHRCACIVLLEYRCPECGKQFNCPANLASHRRWHKPKKESNVASAKKENQNTINTSSTDLSYACEQCGKKFKRQAYLRKHLSTHNKIQSDSPVPVPVAVAEPVTEPMIVTPAHKQVAATVVAISNERIYETYARSTSSVSSLHSFSVRDEVVELGEEEEEEEEEEVEHEHAQLAYANTRPARSYDYENDTLSDTSSRSSVSSSASYGRLQIIESGLTEEENIAAAALTNLRNCASVIKHTTLAH